MSAGWELAAAERSVAATAAPASLTLESASKHDAALPLHVRGYSIEGGPSVPTNILAGVVSRYTGPNVTVKQLVEAAADIQSAYRKHGYRAMSVVIGQCQVTNGVIPITVFQAGFPQIIIAGQRYLITSNGVTMASSPTEEELASVSPESEAGAGAGSRTNVGPRFKVEKYLVEGNSLLSPPTIAQALTNAAGAFGTNVSFSGIQSALSGLQEAYRARGYVTVSVGLPQQKLTNATVRVQVTEGKLAGVQVVGNRYFSSNNVMRALPSLRTNAILNGLIFQAELNRANANRDRQIYPVIGPGPEAGTSELTLKVKDRLPFHTKIELNNQNSPGTPELRLNTSAVYNNLWQHEHSLGVQYNFSPEAYKLGHQWDFFDTPLVATYSAFYRLPLGTLASLADVVASQPGTFGYNEATRQFNLPPPSGRPELNLYASRATIDTGAQMLSNTKIFDLPGVRSISQQVVQQDLTINETIGFRLSEPLPATKTFRSTLSGGLDFKSYSLTDYKTNAFHLSEITYKADGSPNPPIVSTVATPTPPTQHLLEYIPVSLNYSASLHTPRLTLTPGLGVKASLWHSSSRSDLPGITGSTQSSGYWVALDPSLSVELVLHTNWVLTLRANGQWSSEPLINNEQFGAGGVASVRGYREGEVFGDNGWHVTLEQQTPPHVVGFISSSLPLTVRGSIYMDFAQTYLLDPQNRPGHVKLWGTGVGGIISVGPYWDARFLFSMPLLDAGTTHAYQPFFSFALTAQL